MVAPGEASDHARLTCVLDSAAAARFAGAAAAFAYAFHCPEMQAPFLAVWYVLGMLIPAAVGAALGQRMLRW